MADGVSQASAESSVSAAETHWWGGLAGQEHVTKLTEENMEPFLKNHEKVLVMFYAPWCVHCKNAKAQYAHAGLLLSSEEGSTTSKLAAVDCTKHPRLHHLFKVRGYPTFKFFHRGVEKGIYNGGRKSHEIVNFMLRRN